MSTLLPNDLTIEVVNRETYQGKDAHYIGRPTLLGNPFSIRQHGGRDNAIAKYKTWLNLQWTTNNKQVIRELKYLATQLQRDKKIVLSCWCAPKACHANVIGQALLNIIDRGLLKHDTILD